MRGRVKWQIQHLALPCAVFDTRPNPKYTVFSINGALSDLLF